MPFQTLRSLWERMEKDGVPPKIDRSFLTGAEGNKTLVLSGLKFLGLISETGDVNSSLVDLVSADLEHRPQVMHALLNAKYPQAIRLGVQNGTHRQLEETFDAHAGPVV